MFVISVLVRFPTSRRLVHGLICGLGFCAVAGLYALERAGYGGKMLLRWESRYRDVVTTTGRFEPPDERLVFLGIDSASVSLSELDLQTLYSDVAPGSIEFQALNLMAAGWPWSREVHALLAERLLQAGARVVILDLLFPKPGPGDEALQAAIAKFPGQVLTGSNFVPEVIGPGQEAWSLTLPTSSIIPDLSPHHPAIGYVNFWPDFDGVVRRVQYAATLEQMQGGRPPDRVTPDVPRSLAARAAASVGSAETADLLRPRLIRLSGPPGTFTPIPIYQTFVPLYWQRNFGGGSLLRDKIVLIGPAGNWAHDEHATAFGQMPGPELQLNSINALLRQAFLREAPAWSGNLLTALAAAAAWFLTVAIPRTWLRLGAFVLLGAAFLAGIKLAYDQLDTVVLAIPPLLAFGLAGLGSFIYDYTRETLEKLRVRRTLESYVSKDVVRDVLDNPASYLRALGGTRTQVVVLMTDLRGFTTIAEGMDSNQLVTQLNEYLSAMVDDIFAERGSVDKFVGDAILAVWGHLNSSGPAQDAALAVRAFFRMQASLQRLNADWEKRGMQTLSMGCGVNFGEVIFGNIGSSRKMEPTVIGDTVNVVARLEGLTKDYGHDILLGQAAADLLREAYTLQFIDRVAVKGKTKALDLYTIVGPIGETRDAALETYLEIYARAQTTYRAAAFDDAAALFHKCLEHRPHDQVAAIYIERCASLAANPPAEEWTGVHTATHK
jgi:adenylate cyclase